MPLKGLNNSGRLPNRAIRGWIRRPAKPIFGLKMKLSKQLKHFLSASSTRIFVKKQKKRTEI